MLRNTFAVTLFCSIIAVLPWVNETKPSTGLCAIQTVPGNSAKLVSCHPAPPQESRVPPAPEDD